MATQNAITNLSTQMSKQQTAAMETYLAQMLSAKQPLLLAYQRKEITAEEYEEMAGETVVETLTQQFAQDRRRQLRQMYDRVDAGYITQAECEAITGEPYDPSAISPLRVMSATNAVTPTPSTETTEAATPETVTVDASKEG